MSSNIFYVEIITPGGESSFAPLTAESLLIGRSSHSCGLVLDDPRISRVHLRIVYNPNRGITITDLHSANGTRIQGHLLGAGVPITWLVNQEVLMGRTRLVLHYGAFEPNGHHESPLVQVGEAVQS
jgi:pSer/pThr/pTyr-binding forkhead associated (FHA) protein